MKDFIYIKGAAATTVPWIRPHPDLLNLWKEEIFKIKEVKLYKLWICGAAIQGWKTSDVDIIVTGEIVSYESLEKVLVGITREGFRHRQLIDDNWNSQIEKYLMKGPCNQFSISCYSFYENNKCTDKDHLEQREIESIVLADKIIKNSDVYPVRNVTEKVGNSLWKRKMLYPSQKHINKVLEGKRYTREPILLDENTDFRDFIRFIN